MNRTACASRLLAATLCIALQSCSSPSAPSQALPAASIAGRTAAKRRGPVCKKGVVPSAAAQKKGLVYVSSWGEPGCVLIYTPGLAGPVGSIVDGVDMPNGVYIDGKHNFYVANGDQGGSGPANTTVAVYRQGTVTPSRTYSALAFPIGIAVAKDGTVYISDAHGSTGGTGVVREYPPGSMTPSKSFTVAGALSVGLNLDAADNLYVFWWTLTKNKGLVYKYAPGASGGSDLHLDLPSDMVPAYSLAFDAKGNLVIPVETGFLKPNAPQFLAAYAPGSKKARKIWLGSLANLVYGVAFPRDDPGAMYVTGENSNNLLLLTYPGAQVRGAVPVGLASGIAIMPGT
jgi:hypothetical protein